MRELLETEQSYVARLHLLDQASGDPSTPTSQVPAPTQDLALAQPADSLCGFGAASELSPLVPHASSSVLASLIHGSLI